ncbi:hypothetical protein I5U23_17390 [Stenotrophomonas maltophilia]|uniref:Lipoprotein n=1 Tax=Stenotrophomonas riyadhensis TaxID=2859893 RepID=A0ABT2XGS2_9GAMM|nr:hypothetical protein [Stenotrophomonas sp. CFS3442]MBH1619697.1 hypothetical protein [Stenotrophomonas maltophilia]MCV0325142.1 hypothetical protein [Stenotrophomonas sp. CFS3442]HEL4244956.1 hypothetical protein [Stenotrophomonas maltophilia]
MNGRAWFTTVLLCVLSIGCNRDRHENIAVSPADRCAQRMSGGVCVVSAIELFSTSDAFEGRTISVALFYPGNGAKVLFATHDSAEINDLASAIVFSKIADQQDPLIEAGYYRIQATFQRSPQIVVGDGVVPSQVLGGRFAELKTVERLRTLTGMRGFCAEYDDCAIVYSEGILPIPQVGPVSELPAVRE